jgi:acyl carrier protein
MEDHLKQQIMAIIADTLGVDNRSEITGEAEFYADLNATDNEISHIIKIIEDTFNLELGVTDPSQVTTVTQLLDLVEEALI